MTFTFVIYKIYLNKERNGDFCVIVLKHIPNNMSDALKSVGCWLDNLNKKVFG